MMFELKTAEELMEWTQEEVYKYQDIVDKNARMAWSVYKVKKALIDDQKD